MPSAKKNKDFKGTSKFVGKKDVVIVFKTPILKEGTLFPEKLKKANEIISKTKFLED